MFTVERVLERGTRDVPVVVHFNFEALNLQKVGTH